MFPCDYIGPFDIEIVRKKDYLFLNPISYKMPVRVSVMNKYTMSGDKMSRIGFRSVLAKPDMIHTKTLLYKPDE